MYHHTSRYRSGVAIIIILGGGRRGRVCFCFFIFSGFSVFLRFVFPHFFIWSTGWVFRFFFTFWGFFFSTIIFLRLRMNEREEQEQEQMIIITITPLNSCSLYILYSIRKAQGAFISSSSLADDGRRRARPGAIHFRRRLPLALQTESKRSVKPRIEPRRGGGRRRRSRRRVNRRGGGMRAST